MLKQPAGGVVNVPSLHSASAASVSLPVVTGSDLPSAGSGFAGIKKRNVASTMETSEVKLTKVNYETKMFIPTDNACARMAGVAPGEAANLNPVPGSTMSARSSSRATAVFGPGRGSRGSKGPSRHPALDPLPIAPASEASGLPVPGSSTSAQSSIEATAVFGPGTTSGSEQGPEGADRAVAPGGCTAEAFSGWGPEKIKEEIVDIV